LLVCVYICINHVSYIYIYMCVCVGQCVVHSLLGVMCDLIQNIFLCYVMPDVGMCIYTCIYIQVMCYVHCNVHM